MGCDVLEQPEDEVGEMRSLRRHHQSCILNIKKMALVIPTLPSVLTYLYSRNEMPDGCDCLLWIKAVNSSHQGQFQEAIKECASTA
jgi:hypothetical protein